MFPRKPSYCGKFGTDSFIASFMVNLWLTRLSSASPSILPIALPEHLSDFANMSLEFVQSEHYVFARRPPVRCGRRVQNRDSRRSRLQGRFLIT